MLEKNLLRLTLSAWYKHLGPSKAAFVILKNIRVVASVADSLATNAIFVVLSSIFNVFYPILDPARSFKQNVADEGFPCTDTEF